MEYLFGQMDKYIMEIGVMGLNMEEEFGKD